MRLKRINQSPPPRKEENVTMNLCTAMVRRRVIEDDARRDGSAVAFQQESIRIARRLATVLIALIVIAWAVWR